MPVLSMQDELKCAICLEYLVKPTQLHACGHSFCTLCLHTCVQRCGARCPECRMDIAEAPSAPFLGIERAILLSLQSCEQELLRYRQRVADAELSIRQLEDVWKRFRGKKPIYDKEDEIYRCPECHWEIDDRTGICTGAACDLFYPSAVTNADEEEDEEEEDEEEEDEDEEA